MCVCSGAKVLSLQRALALHVLTGRLPTDMSASDLATYVETATANMNHNNGSTSDSGSSHNLLAFCEEVADCRWIS